MPMPEKARRRRLEAPVAGYNKRYWTRTRVLEALRNIAPQLPGLLPTSDVPYYDIKRERSPFDMPPLHRVREYFGCMARGWLAAGVERKRLAAKFIPWTKAEDDYLLQWAGIMTLAHIGQRLHRSYSAVRTRLNKHMGIQSRHNQGHLSAAELAREFYCPYHRVRELLHSGTIPGQFDWLRNRWMVNLDDLTPEMKVKLRAPKTRSYKNSPTDLGDYYRRHGLYRTRINGRQVVVADPAF